MGQPPLAVRLATRFRIAIAIVGALSALIAITSIVTSWIPHVVVAGAGWAVACVAATLFLCATFDMRFVRALSAVNAERRARARQIGRKARFMGLGLPIGDRLLFIIDLCLIVCVFAASSFSTALLSWSGFLLVTTGQIALLVRGYPTDRFVALF